MPTAEGSSPAQGTDKNGPTAAFKSVAKLPTILFTGGNLLNQKFSPELLEGEERVRRFVQLLRTFVSLKLWHVQFNIVSSEVLRAAQREPEKYRDLIVRVAGYCAQFVTLDPTTQNDIISRTEQKVV
jgi:formate C-acetyltransferase